LVKFEIITDQLSTLIKALYLIMLHYIFSNILLHRYVYIIPVALWPNSGWWPPLIRFCDYHNR